MSIYTDLIIRRPNGRQFAYVGDYTLTALDDFGGRWVVTRDIDGDEVVIAAGLTLDQAIATAKAQEVAA
jgi:acyl CoA:acetate/3-ketoacid CoA transferase alpha subunit